LKYFSGGNQQKAVLSKWLATNPRILLLDEPTRGIDVGAKKEIYTLIRNLADSGISILFISSELEEIIGVCDRMLVMREGEITSEFKKSEATQENIMKAAAN
jgi:ABC-type sugar transport system ATPase subunit